MKPKDQREAEYVHELKAMLSEDYEEELWYMLHDEPVTADGCRVEPDGICSHGYHAPLLLLSMI